jgi:adenosylmethionine-8-amino-7-oxononanoate aminotransferase
LADGDASIFAHGQTFAGQPLAAAVGLAVLTELVDKNMAGARVLLTLTLTLPAAN